MADLVCFCVSENIYYCPIQLNSNVLTTNEGQYDNSSVSQDALENIVKTIRSKPCNNKPACYIIDFFDCLGIVETTPQIVEKLLAPNIVVITGDKLKSTFLSYECDLCEECGTSEMQAWFIGKSINEVLDTYIKNIKGMIGDKNPTELFYSLVLTSFFYQDIKNNKNYNFTDGNYKYLESSNVYVNKYINVKSLFLDYNHMMLTIKGLQKVIRTQFADCWREASLLGVSNNGIILANLLSYELNLPVQSLNRLGPIYCLEDDAKKLNNFNDKKYILVSDVICMGGEFRMTKGIVNILGSQLIGGICVVKIRDVYRGDKEEKVYSLLKDINEIEIDGEKIDYQVYIDRYGTKEKEN